MNADDGMNENEELWLASLYILPMLCPKFPTVGFNRGATDRRHLQEEAWATYATQERRDARRLIQ